LVATGASPVGPLASFVTVRALVSVLAPSAPGPGKPSVSRGAGFDDPIPAEADAGDAARPLASFGAVRASRSAAGSTATGSEPVRGPPAGATPPRGRGTRDSSTSFGSGRESPPVSGDGCGGEVSGSRPRVDDGSPARPGPGGRPAVAPPAGSRDPHRTGAMASFWRPG